MYFVHLRVHTFFFFLGDSLALHYDIFNINMYMYMNVCINILYDILIQIKMSTDAFVNLFH